MSITVSAVKARQNLGELLNLASIKHEEIIIERAGKKIARLTAVDEEAVHEPAVAYRSVKEYIRTERTRWASLNDEDAALVFEEFQKVRGCGKKTPVLEDIPEGSVPDCPDILDLCGVGKEMWERTGLTPDEYVRKEREEWG